MTELNGILDGVDNGFLTEMGKTTEDNEAAEFKTVYPQTLENCSVFHKVCETDFFRFVAVSALSIAVVNVAKAEDNTPPALTALRYDEDYSYLKDPAARTNTFDSIKYISLSDRGDSYITFGGQLRDRYEYFQNYLFGRPPGPKRIQPTPGDGQCGPAFGSECASIRAGNQRHGARPLRRAAAKRR